MNWPNLTEEQKAELAALDNMPDEEIDFSDITEVTDWSNATRAYHLLQAGETPPRLSKLESDEQAE